LYRALNEKILFDRFNNITKVKIEPKGVEVYIAIAELVAVSKDEYDDKLLEALNMLSERSVKNNYNYLLLTCVSSKGLDTKVGVVSRNKETAWKELEVICSIIETLTHGFVRCLHTNDFFDTVEECITPQSLSPLNFLMRVLRRSNAYQIGNKVIVHPLSVIPYPLIHTAREYQYLASVFSRGSIPIGHLYSNPNLKVMISDEHILRHILIVGSTGSGKSTTASVLADKVAEKGYAVVIIDWHGEYESLLQGSKSVTVYTNPLKGSVLESLSLEDLIKREPLSFIEILESSLELTPPQAHILEDAVNLLAQKFTGQGYCIDLIIDIIQNSAATARWFTESREALLRKLKPLSSSYLNIQWSKLSRIKIEKGKIYIFDVSAISNTRVRRIIASLLIRSIILNAQYNNIVKPIMLVVDEAHNIFHSENPLSTLIAEVRKWSLGFTIITQAPSMLSPVVIKNTNTKIIHALKTTSDINAVISSSILKKEHKKLVLSLKPGEALLVIPEVVEPILIKIPKL
jgi:energy-coupling factor transporter ATP-binding protein EcfA2